MKKSLILTISLFIIHSGICIGSDAAEKDAKNIKSTAAFNTATNAPAHQQLAQATAPYSNSSTSSSSSASSSSGSSAAQAASGSSSDAPLSQNALREQMQKTNVLLSKEQNIYYYLNLGAISSSAAGDFASASVNDGSFKKMALDNLKKQNKKADSATFVLNGFGLRYTVSLK